MALNGKILGDEMLMNLRGRIKSKYPNAIPTDLQKPITDAVSVGIVNAMVKATGFGQPGVPSLGGPDKVTGIFNLSADVMTQLAIANVQAEIGSVGEAIDLFFGAIFDSIVKHLGIYTVVQSNGFSGSVVSIMGAESDLVFSSIYKELPPNMQASMKSVKGEVFIRSIAKAFAAQIKTGQSLPFSPAGDPTGLLIATFI